MRTRGRRAASQKWNMCPLAAAEIPASLRCATRFYATACRRPSQTCSQYFREKVNSLHSREVRQSAVARDPRLGESSGAPTRARRDAPPGPNSRSETTLVARLALLRGAPPLSHTALAQHARRLPDVLLRLLWQRCSGDDRRRDLIGSELESLRKDLRSAMLTISALSASLDEERSNSARLAKHFGASHTGASSNAVLQKGPPAAATRRENQENIPNRPGASFISPPNHRCASIAHVQTMTIACVLTP